MLTTKKADVQAKDCSVITIDGFEITRKTIDVLKNFARYTDPEDARYIILQHISILGQLSNDEDSQTPIPPAVFYLLETLYELYKSLTPERRAE